MTSFELKFMEIVKDLIQLLLIEMMMEIYQMEMDAEVIASMILLELYITQNRFEYAHLSE